MNYSKIKVPFLKDIKERADEFRKKVWGNSIPIDIEEIIELKLKIELMPFLGLRRSFGIDAFITSSWNLIYVDEDEYKRFPNRLKFSLAHEIGHFVLHKNLYNSFKIKKIEDLHRFIEQIPQEQHNNLEMQANIFANNLLVPKEELIIERKKALIIIKDKFSSIKEINKSILDSYLAIPISKKFEVSEEVIQISLSYLDNNNEFSE